MRSSRVFTFPDADELPNIGGGPNETRYVFKTITPVFGAGVEAGKIDEATPLRGTTVRGHLRFWWRVTCGRQFATVEQLRKREAEVWGLASNPGSVSIVISSLAAESEDCGAAEHFRTNYPPYALFPFKTTDVPPKFSGAWESLGFTLLVRAGSAANDVETALWAWANFGGIGSRTRRGCGALFCSDFAPAGIPPATWVADKLRDFPASPGESAWPRLAHEPILKKVPESPLAAWERAIKVLADFRQNAPVGRNGGTGGFGRSRWPEADSLRARSRDGNPRHMTTITVDGNAMPAFPRAELGLPYQVEFKKKDGDTFNRDTVNNVHVYPKDSNRMASPVIVRPLAIGPNGTRAVPMILRIDGPLLAKVRVVPNDRPAFRVEPVVRNPALALYPDSPMAGRSAQGSALEAFLDFAAKRFE